MYVILEVRILYILDIHLRKNRSRKYIKVEQTVGEKRNQRVGSRDATPREILIYNRTPSRLYILFFACHAEIRKRIRLVSSMIPRALHAEPGAMIRTVSFYESLPFLHGHPL